MVPAHRPRLRARDGYPRHPRPALDRRNAGADPGRGAKSARRRVVGRHRGSACGGGRGRPDPGLRKPAHHGTARLGAGTMAPDTGADGGRLCLGARLRLQRGTAGAPQPARPALLGGFAEPRLPGRNPDGEPEFLGHRLHRNRHAGTDDGRGAGLPIPRSAAPQYQRLSAQRHRAHHGGGQGRDGAVHFLCPQRGRGTCGGLPRGPCGALRGHGL